MRSKDERGFTLIELLIVVGVLIILGAITVPLLARARMAANEANAVGTIRLLVRSQHAYVLAFNQSYSPDLYSLGPVPPGAAPTPGRADLVDIVISGSTLGNGTFTRQGYSFTYTAAGSFPNIGAYTLTAVPVVPDSTGRRRFYTDQTSLVRFNLAGPAGPADPLLSN